MNEQEYDSLWWNRVLRYPDAQPLPEGRAVHIRVDHEYAATYAGQAAAITAASLFSRMTKSVAVDVPALPVHPLLPWSGSALDTIVIETMSGAHPYGRYKQRPSMPGDLRVSIGPSGDGLVVHGSGWGAYCGSEPSPLLCSDEANPFGAAFAVIAAAARLQLDPHAGGFEPSMVDTYLWRAGFPSPETPKILPGFKIGELWCVGAGSVGSCSLFFLTLATRDFHAVLVDCDKVKVENVTRSAPYSWKDALAENPKVEAACRWLQQAGVQQVEPHLAWLDDILERWVERAPGTPDILISTANERNVRAMIENGYPPLQVYATTGRNWQATLLRHVPMKDPCSLCVPGGTTIFAPTLCATGAVPQVDGSGNGDDVALPFLSYGAGLMTAAEISKLSVTGRPSTPNRVFFQPRALKLHRAVALESRNGCVCQERDRLVYQDAIRGSRYASLSE